MGGGVFIGVCLGVWSLKSFRWWVGVSQIIASALVLLRHELRPVLENSLGQWPGPGPELDNKFKIDSWALQSKPLTPHTELQLWVRCNISVCNTWLISIISRKKMLVKCLHWIVLASAIERKNKKLWTGQVYSNNEQVYRYILAAKWSKMSIS